MPRQLKTYQTSLGFYDLAIAAPSMKAALEAWGAGSNLFHQGHAKETDDPDIVAATMAKPGVVLKRPAGSSGPFAEHADLPDLDDEGAQPKKISPAKPARRGVSKTGVKGSLKAGAAFEREQKRRDAERRKEEAALEKERARRVKLVPRLRRPWTLRSASTKSDPKSSKPSGRTSRSGSRRRTPAGKTSG